MYNIYAYITTPGSVIQRNDTGSGVLIYESCNEIYRYAYAQRFIQKLDIQFAYYHNLGFGIIFSHKSFRRIFYFELISQWSKHK